jgi:signal recognition particle receptor subunit beta
VIAGGFGVGKTTMVQALSEIPPLVTEEALTTASVGLDDVSAVPGKTTTTVAMDFGRISMDDLVLYLFGTPGQDRFWFMWDELAPAPSAPWSSSTCAADGCSRRSTTSSRHLPVVVP